MRFLFCLKQIHTNPRDLACGTSSKDNLPTEPYKGVRDFYPEDMAIQRYMFDV